MSVEVRKYQLESEWPLKRSLHFHTATKQVQESSPESITQQCVIEDRFDYRSTIQENLAKGSTKENSGTTEKWHHLLYYHINDDPAAVNMASTVVVVKGTNSPEYKAIQKCYTDLADVLDLSASDAAGKLFQADLFGVGSPSGTTMMDSVLRFVKVDAMKFYKFLEVLRNLDNTNDVLQKLHQAFCDQIQHYISSGSYEPTKIHTGAAFLTFSRGKLYSNSPDSREFTGKLYGHLKHSGCDPWMDAENFQSGDSLSVTIYKTLDECKAVVPVVTRGYAQSLWCMKELYYAMFNKKSQKHSVLIEEGWEREEVGGWLQKALKEVKMNFMENSTDEEKMSEVAMKVAKSAKRVIKLSWSPLILPVFMILLRLISPVASTSGFIEIPMSQTVSVNETAEFRCNHSIADSIRWKVNGSVLSSIDFPTGIHQRVENRLHILTIMGLLKYNGTEVVGDAFRFSDGSSVGETEPAAILNVLMNTSSAVLPGFVEVPLSLNVTVGAVATFHCSYPGADYFIWLINGTTLTKLPGDLEGTFHTNGRHTALTVTALPVYNGSMIQCRAHFSQDELITPAAILKIQGPLNGVADLRIENSVIKWEPPFSLDLTEVEIDISFYVEKHNITCGMKDVVISDCNITSTNYTFTPDGYLYEFIITPRSNVEEAINGTPSQPLIVGLPEFSESSNQLSLGTFGKDSGLRAYQTELTYSAHQPAQPPSSYALSLESFDGLENKPYVYTDVSMTEPGSLTLDVIGGLTFRRLWNCTILAYGCEENGILNGELSTHDFRNIKISSPLAGSMIVTGSFTDDSTGSGLLIIIATHSDVHYHKATRTGMLMSTLISGVPGGDYTVSVFVIEENGMPFERVATLPKTLILDPSDPVQPSFPIEYSLNFTSSVVCVQCFFKEKDIVECLAVVHEQSNRLSSGGVMNISSHRFKRNGYTAYGCIDHFDRYKQQVGVIGGRQVMSPTVGSSHNTSSLVAIPVTVVLLLLVVVLTLLTIVLYKNRQVKRKIQVRNAVTVTLGAVRHIDAEHGCGNEYECLSNESEKVALEISSPGTYENTRGVESPIATSILQQETTAGTLGEQKEPVYAYTITTSQKVKVPSVVDRKEEYNEIVGFKNSQGLHYANVTCSKTSSLPQTLLDEERKTGHYSELKHQQVDSKDCDNGSGNNSQHSVIKTPTPFTLPNLVSVLQPVAPKWKELGETMSVDEDDIDEIYTKDEMDEDCLCELIERFIVVHHNWKDVVAALRKINEETLADEICKHHVLHSAHDGTNSWVCTETSKNNSTIDLLDEANGGSNELENEKSQSVAPHPQFQKQPHADDVHVPTPGCICYLSITQPEVEINPTDHRPPFVTRVNTDTSVVVPEKTNSAQTEGELMLSSPISEEKSEGSSASEEEDDAIAIDVGALINQETTTEERNTVGASEEEDEAITKDVGALINQETTTEERNTVASAIQPEDVNQIDRVAVYMGNGSTTVCRPVSARSGDRKRTYCIPHPGDSEDLPQRETQPLENQSSSADSACFSSATLSQDASASENSESQSAVLRTRSSTLNEVTSQDNHDGPNCQGFFLPLETEVYNQLVQNNIEEKKFNNLACHQDFGKTKNVVPHQESGGQANSHCNEVTSCETDAPPRGSSDKDSKHQMVIILCFWLYVWCFWLYVSFQSFLLEKQRGIRFSLTIIIRVAVEYYIN